MARPKKDESISTSESLEEILGNRSILSVKEFLSTGSTLLDYALANKRDGGVAVGRIHEIYGSEASGKSLLASHIMASTQKKDGIAVFLDIERAADEAFMKRMGVDTEKNFICPKPPKSIEDVFAFLEKTAITVKTKFPNRLVTVVWDSVAATHTQATSELDFGEGALAADARAMSSCFKKAIDIFEEGWITLICINQIREKIGVLFGDNTTTPHGRALPFYSSSRIQLTPIGKLKEGSEKDSRIIGVKTRARVTKNKCAPSWRTAEFPIHFDFGIQDEISWIEFLKSLGLIKSSGAWSSLHVDGEEYKYQGTSGFKNKLSENPHLRNKILDIIDDKMVIKFEKRPENIIIEDSITEGIP